MIVYFLLTIDVKNEKNAFAEKMEIGVLLNLHLEVLQINGLFVLLKMKKKMCQKI